MNLLITGGRGFIGTNFILNMIDKSEINKLVNFDCCTYAGMYDNLEHLKDHPKYTEVIGSVVNREDLLECFVKYDISHVINFAAESHVDRSISNPRLFFETNSLGVGTLLQVCLDCKTEKVVQIGTDEVYGSLGEEDYASVEWNVLKPRSPYSASKASGDLIALSYFHTYDLDVSVTRSSNNYGPYQYPEKLIPRFITNVLQDQKVPLMGDGSNIRDWIHVSDNCSGIWKVLTMGEAGEIYNIGGGNRKTNKEITLLILDHLGKDESWIETIDHRLGHDFKYALDSGRIKRMLNWKPRKKFEDGLKETVDWYVKNPYWWRRVKTK